MKAIMSSHADQESQHKKGDGMTYRNRLCSLNGGNEIIDQQMSCSLSISAEENSKLSKQFAHVFKFA